MRGQVLVSYIPLADDNPGEMWIVLQRGPLGRTLSYSSQDFCCSFYHCNFALHILQRHGHDQSTGMARLHRA